MTCYLMRRPDMEYESYLSKRFPSIFITIPRSAYLGTSGGKGLLVASDKNLLEYYIVTGDSSILVE